MHVCTYNVYVRIILHVHTYTHKKGRHTKYLCQNIYIYIYIYIYVYIYIYTCKYVSVRMYVYPCIHKCTETQTHKRNRIPSPVSLCIKEYFFFSICAVHVPITTSSDPKTCFFLTSVSCPGPNICLTVTLIPARKDRLFGPGEMSRPEHSSNRDAYFGPERQIVRTPRDVSARSFL